MTKSKFLSFYQDIVPDASACYDAVLIALTDLQIWSNLVMVGAMATIRVEVGRGYKPVREVISQDLANKNYGNRYGNRPGTNDGYNYRGGGLIQLTFRGNYLDYGNKIGIDIASNPDLIMDINVSAKILAQYFKDKGIDKACNISDWLTVRKLVNGINSQTGLPNGWDEFKSIIGQFTQP